MRILEKGKVSVDVVNMPEEFHKQAIENFVASKIRRVNTVVINKEVESITHYWIVFKDGKRIAYFGTEESFKSWTSSFLN